MRASGSDKTVVPRELRKNVLERLIMPWRLPACPALTLPEAVSLKRFFAPDFVFILGILLVPFSRCFKLEISFIALCSEFKLSE